MEKTYNVPHYETDLLISFFSITKLAIKYSIRKFKKYFLY